MPFLNLDIAITSPHANFLLAFASIFCLFTLAMTRRYGGIRRMLPAAFALSLLMIAVLLSSIALPGRNSLVNLYKYNKCESLLGGMSGFLCAVTISRGEPFRRGRMLGYLSTVAIYGVISLTLAGEILKNVPSSLIPGGGVGFGTARAATASGRARLEPFAELDFTPFCMISGPGGALYVGGANNDINYNGIIVRVVQGPNGKPVTKIVAEHLVRPHGLAFHDGDLFVARTGEVSMTENGAIKYKPSGAVTRLTDTDGDGVFDLYRDIVTDLPGSYGLHQVSGIAFEGGYMYLSVGVAEDHAPVVEAYEGTILRARPDGSELTVFARGVRNPYDLAFGPERQLFCTDNDADERNRGDVIYHVRADDHMGFPYTQTVGSPRIKGVTPPAYEPGKGEALEGLAYAPPGSLPKDFDDCFYVASLWDRSVKRVRVKRDADGRYSASEVDTIVDMMFPLDLVVAPEEKSIYVLTGYAEKTIQRIVID